MSRVGRDVIGGDPRPRESRLNDRGYSNQVTLTFLSLFLLSLWMSREKRVGKCPRRGPSAKGPGWGVGGGIEAPGRCVPQGMCVVRGPSSGVQRRSPSRRGPSSVEGRWGTLPAESSEIRCDARSRREDGSKREEAASGPVREPDQEACRGVLAASSFAPRSSNRSYVSGAPVPPISTCPLRSTQACAWRPVSSSFVTPM